MNGIFVKELEDIEQLINKGEYNRASERIDSIYAEEKTSVEEKIKCKIFKKRIYSEASKYSEAMKLGEEAFEESQKLNNKHLMFDSLIQSPYVYFLAGEYELRKEKIKLAGQILDSFDDKTSREYFQRKATFLTMKRDSFEKSLENLEESIDISIKFGFNIQLADSYQRLGNSYLWSGEITKAIKFNQKSLDLSEKLEYPLGINNAVSSKAVCYMHRGELDLALDYFLQSRSFIEEVNDLYAQACLFIDLGYLYWLGKDLKSAFEYYKKSISLYKESKVVSTRHLPWTLFRMNLVLIEMEQYEEAYKNLEQIELLSLIKDKPIFKIIYHLAKAVLLKTKTDDDNWDEAMTLLEEVADEEIVYLELNGLVIFHLCDAYLKKIQNTNDLEVFGKLKNRIINLTEMAKEQKSHILLIQSLLLQSKLELIEFNIDKGQLLLEKAQILAEEKGIIKLAKVVSNEIDILLSQLSTWEDMSKYLPSLEERLEFTHVEDVLSRIMKDSIIHETFTDEKEAPLFFLVLNDEGAIHFSELFSDVTLDNELLQEILAAIARFKANETLETGIIKRIKYRNYTIAINSQVNLLLVYAFIGKSYHALQKFRFLIEEFRTFTSEWTTFFNKIKDNKELTLSDRMQLSEYLESVFV